MKFIKNLFMFIAIIIIIFFYASIINLAFDPELSNFARGIIYFNITILLSSYLGFLRGKYYDKFSSLRHKVLQLEKKAMKASNINIYRKRIEKLDLEIMAYRNRGLIDELDKAYLTDRLYQILRIPVQYE